MKIVIWIIVLVVVLGGLWYFVGPAVTDTVVDEALPTPEELAAMDPEELTEIEDDMMQKFAEEPDSEVIEGMPLSPDREPVVLITGSFADADSVHKGSGDASVYEFPDDSLLLRFENFSVTNGPDLHVLLSESANPTDSDSLGEYIDLGSLKGNQGDQNYTIPAGTDVSLYKSVVIYCKPFHVVFSVAGFE